MINRTVYALRHKPTGRCMPAWRSSFSRWEPAEDASTLWFLPRLFPTLRSAQNALTAYLRGPGEATYGTDGSYEEGYYNYRDVPVPTGKPEHPRNRGDFEIVTVELKELSK